MAIDRLPINDGMCIAVLRCAICGEDATSGHSHDENKKSKVISVNNKYINMNLPSNTLETKEHKR